MIIVVKPNGLDGSCSGSIRSSRSQQAVRVSRNAHEILRIAVATMLVVDSTEYAIASNAGHRSWCWRSTQANASTIQNSGFCFRCCPVLHKSPDYSTVMFVGLANVRLPPRVTEACTPSSISNAMEEASVNATTFPRTPPVTVCPFVVSLSSR